jgi:hypothetical protein
VVGGVVVLLVEGVLMLHHRHWCCCYLGIAVAAEYGTVWGQGHRIAVLWGRQGWRGVWALSKCSGVLQGWLGFCMRFGGSGAEAVIACAGCWVKQCSQSCSTIQD